MENDIFYVRNTRPNRVVLKYAGLRIILERRGAYPDTAPLPEDARRDPGVIAWLRKGVLEEITKEDFIALGEKDFASPDYRGKDEAPLKKQQAPDLPMGDYNAEIDMKLPYTIPKDLLNNRDFLQENLSPKLEWRDDLIPTGEELKEEAKPARGRPAKK